MDSKKFIVGKLILKYAVWVLVFKYCYYVVPVSVDRLKGFPGAFIPIAYLVVKLLFYNVLDKMRLSKEDYYMYVLVGYTIVNVFFGMPLKYTIYIIVFILGLKNKYVSREEGISIVEEYLEQKEKNK